MIYAWQLNLEGTEMPDSPSQVIVFDPLIFFDLADQILYDCRPNVDTNYYTDIISISATMTYNPQYYTTQFNVTVTDYGDQNFLYSPTIYADNNKYPMNKVPIIQGSGYQDKQTTIYSATIKEMPPDKYYDLAINLGEVPNIKKPNCQQYPSGIATDFKRGGVILTLPKSTLPFSQILLK